MKTKTATRKGGVFNLKYRGLIKKILACVSLFLVYICFLMFANIILVSKLNWPIYCSTIFANFILPALFLTFEAIDLKKTMLEKWMSFPIHFHSIIIMIFSYSFLRLLIPTISFIRSDYEQKR
jgi:hypothetical protein